VCLWRGKEDIFKPVFHASQTWQLIREIRPTVQWHKSVWFSGATPKYPVISWIAVDNRLATGELLLKWNNHADATWILCQASRETRYHIYFSCPYSETIWKNLMVKILGRPNYSNNWNHVLEMLTLSAARGSFCFVMCSRHWYTQFGMRGMEGAMAKFITTQTTWLASSTNKYTTESVHSKGGEGNIWIKLWWLGLHHESRDKDFYFMLFLNHVGWKLDQRTHPL